MAHQFNSYRAGAPVASSGGLSLDANAASPIPDIGEHALLLVCPTTKHPVDPYKNCIEVAIIEAGKIQSPGLSAMTLAEVIIVAIVVAATTSVLARRFQR
jgi:hypothetical protein